MLPINKIIYDTRQKNKQFVQLATTTATNFIQVPIIYVLLLFLRLLISVKKYVDLFIYLFFPNKVKNSIEILQ